MRRAALLLATVLGAVLLTGLLPVLSGRDPALAVLRARAAEREADPAALAAVRAELGLDEPAWRRALGWPLDALRGDLGTSWVSGRPVADGLGRAAGVSLTLAALATLVAVVVAVVLAAPTLRRALRGRPPAASVGAGVLAALPEFLLAALGLALVAVRWRALPTSGWTDLRSAVLPATALGLPTGAVLAVLLGGSGAGALREPWVRTWRAAGLPARRVLVGASRRAAADVAPQLSLLAAGLVGGAVAVEQVFAVPGIGRTAYTAARAQDVPVVQACVVLLLLAGLLAAAVGTTVQRLLLGGALRDGALVPAAAPARPRGARLGLGLLALGAVVLVGGLLRDPDRVEQGRRLAGPSAALPLGADAVGRDLWARLAHGALPTLGTAVAVSAVCLVVGLAVGVLARSAAAPAPAVVVAVVPAVLVGVVVAGTVGPGPAGAALAVAAVAWSPLAVHARAAAATERAAAHLAASRALGAGRLHLLRRHVVPAVLAPVLAHALVRLPGVALALAALGFLGLGAPPPSPEWGALLAEGLGYVERAPWAVAVPAAGLVWLGAVAACAPALLARTRTKSTAPGYGVPANDGVRSAVTTSPAAASASRTAGPPMPSANGSPARV